MAQKPGGTIRRPPLACPDRLAGDRNAAVLGRKGQGSESRHEKRVLQQDGLGHEADGIDPARPAAGSAAGDGNHLFALLDNAGRTSRRAGVEREGGGGADAPAGKPRRPASPVGPQGLRGGNPPGPRRIQTRSGKPGMGCSFRADMGSPPRRALRVLRARGRAGARRQAERRHVAQFRLLQVHTGRLAEIADHASDDRRHPVQHRHHFGDTHRPSPEAAHGVRRSLRPGRERRPPARRGPRRHQADGGGLQPNAGPAAPLRGRPHQDAGGDRP